MQDYESRSVLGGPRHKPQNVGELLIFLYSDDEEMPTITPYTEKHENFRLTPLSATVPL